ncbi:MAG: IS1182 family transposase [Lachnospiraceae bacterium]|nr:IS1182 family transposase [Lachnospiraceae bacterium]
MNNSTTTTYPTINQGVLPMFISDCLDICDPVFTFDKLIGGMNLEQYLKKIPEHRLGRVRYNPVRMLKTVLFGFMDQGYISLRGLEENCKVNVRYMYLMDHQTPSYRSFGYFINEILDDSIENLFDDINHKIFDEEGVDLNHVYIDGSKFEANANKYTWVWKKATEKSRYRLYAKITSLIEEINTELFYSELRIETRTEYVPDYLDQILKRLKEFWKLDPDCFVSGKGHHKSTEQRYYQQMLSYAVKLREYTEKISICGSDRNSYSKTDHDATFMRIKKDYLGNDQLLPAYNVQLGIADEYIAVADISQYRSDMDCFIPLMKKFNEIYGFYPKYPIADAGYGSYNNYIFCEQNSMEKYMKFPMFEKETKDRDYHNDPYRALNFKIDDQGIMRCPNNKAFHFLYRSHVRGNNYGREEEYYQCEDCTGCPYASKCKKTDKNRTIRINQELTSMHQEVLDNLQSIQGVLLRMNRTIQAEGTFGIMKNDREYKRIERRGLKSVRLELFLVCIGHNLYKYHNKQLKIPIAA